MNTAPQRSVLRGLCDALLLVALGAFAAVIPVPAQAQQQQPPQNGPGNGPGNGPRRQPPAEAFTACDGHTSGDACSVDLHGHHVTGTCAPSQEQRLFCRPEHMPPPPSGEGPQGGAPPQKAR